jgi:hypothetical protein
MVALESIRSDSDVDSHDESSEDGDMTMTVRKNAEAELEDEWKRLAASEGKAVACARTIVLVALLLAAAFVMLGIRDYIQFDQRNDFEKAFGASAEKILESFHNSVKRRLEAGKL